MKVKCDCGHVNPHGTVLCEACGKVLDEKDRISYLWTCGMKEAQDGLKLTIKRSLIRFGTFSRLLKWEFH